MGGEDDPSFLSSVLGQYLEDLPRHVETIHSAIEQEDSQGLLKAAHALKGSSHNVGALPLSEVCLILETLGREGRVTEAKEVWPRFLYERQRTEEAMRWELQPFLS